MSLDPGELMVALAEGRDRLQQAEDPLADAELEWEAAREAWERTSLIAAAEIALDEDKHGKTSERTRQGLVLRAYQNDPVYLDYVAARAKHAAVNKRYRVLEATVNAGQTLAKLLNM